MKRVIEPELMADPEQAEAYANADFEVPHGRILKMFDIEFPDTDIQGEILDLGCGPGDITFRFARRFPKSGITGIDGAAAMIKLANERKSRETEIGDRVTFVESLIPGAAIPGGPYGLIVSNSLLHHLHNPLVQWETILQYASPGTKVFVVDLLRPESAEKAKRIVNTYSGNEPEILKRDFYNSLLAAFKPSEVEGQLSSVGLAELSVKSISDWHLVVYGEKD